MYNIYAIVILILFDIPRFSVNDLHQIQVAAPSPRSRKFRGRIKTSYTSGSECLEKRRGSHVGEKRFENAERESPD